jgi:hypothetical protein
LGRKAPGGSPRTFANTRWLRHPNLESPSQRQVGAGWRPARRVLLSVRLNRYGSEEDRMPWVIVVLLFTLWGVGIADPGPWNGLVHLLFVAAIVALALALRRGPRERAGSDRLPVGRPGNQARPWALAEALASPLASLRPVSQRQRLAATAYQLTGTLRVGRFKPRSRDEQAALDAASLLLRRS